MPFAYTHGSHLSHLTLQVNNFTRRSSRKWSLARVLQLHRFSVATLTEILQRPDHSLARLTSSDEHASMTLGEIAAQAATSGERVLIQFACSSIYVSWCIQAPCSSTNDLTPSQVLVLIYRPRKDERPSWPE